MCLVEVEKAPKPLPACATPIMEGMKVWTKSEKALTAQKDTMEFLLINHPLDCPICDQGGECELQDLSMAFGGDSSSYKEIKRVVVDKEIGELVATEMTRCIQCTRCVRFGEEVSGMRELGATGRGDSMEIGTFVEKSLDSELSGNIIDICPVGALTAKPSRYHSRSWEMLQTEGVGSHDSVGSNVRLHTFKNQIVRVIAGENEAINECWISDRDRFSYQGVYAKDRVKTPMLKINGVWKEVDWSLALETVANDLRNVNPESVGVLASARATLEEHYLLQKLMRSIGVNSIDHRLRQTDFHDQENTEIYPSLGMSIADIENLDAVMLIGSNVRKEQPMINHKIRKAALKGASITSINSRELSFNYTVAEQQVVTPNEMVNALAVLAKASYTLSKNKIPAGLSDLLKSVRANKSAKTFVENLAEAKNAAVFVGSIAEQHPAYSAIRVLALAIAENTGAKIGFIGGSANTSGAWLAGLVPHRKEAGEILEEAGKNVSQMLNHPKKVYVLLDVELDTDSDNPQQALAALNQADCVIAISPYANKQMLANADIILPSAAYSETSGTYVNIEGKWQSFKAASKSYENARPAWKILRVLGNQLNVAGFDYVSSKDILNELKEICDKADTSSLKFEASGIYAAPDPIIGSALQRIGEVAEYACDSLVRRAEALQKSKPEQNLVQINTSELEKLGLENLEMNVAQEVQVKQGGVMVSMPLAVNNLIPDGCALIMSGTKSSRLLGSAFGEIEISL
ncbi:UNVERIFIED_CONTAM: hypothetical protein GTU68_035879 [Idotea baltica]|nr:hypothetical protein [Idotea baltica]